MLYDKIKKLCKERGVSISHVEEACGFSRGYLGKWNNIVPSVINARKVADYFKVPLEYFCEEN